MQSSSLVNIIFDLGDVMKILNRLQFIANELPDIGPIFDLVLDKVWDAFNITPCTCYRYRLAINSRFILHCLEKRCTATKHLCYEVPECFAGNHRCLCAESLFVNRAPIFFCLGDARLKKQHYCGCWSSYSVCHLHGKDDRDDCATTLPPVSYRVHLAAEFNDIATSTMLHLLAFFKQLQLPRMHELACDLT